jgi:hypothetical protein
VYAGLGTVAALGVIGVRPMAARPALTTPAASVASRLHDRTLQASTGGLVFVQVERSQTPPAAIIRWLKVHSGFI